MKPEIYVPDETNVEHETSSLAIYVLLQSRTEDSEEDRLMS